MGWVVNATTRPLYPREQPGTHCIGGWVGPKAGLDGCGKSRPHRDSILGMSNPYRVAIPTTLSRPTHIRSNIYLYIHESPFEIQNPSYRNLIGRSTKAPQPGLLPSSILPPTSSQCVVIPTRTKSVCVSKTCYFFLAFFKNCVIRGVSVVIASQILITPFNTQNVMETRLAKLY